jgi:hypothetical protein
MVFDSLVLARVEVVEFKTAPRHESMNKNNHLYSRNVENPRMNANFRGSQNMILERLCQPCSNKRQPSSFRREKNVSHLLPRFDEEKRTISWENKCQIETCDANFLNINSKLHLWCLLRPLLCWLSRLLFLDAEINNKGGKKLLNVSIVDYLKRISTYLWCSTSKW